MKLIPLLPKDLPARTLVRTPFGTGWVERHCSKGFWIWMRTNLAGENITHLKVKLMHPWSDKKHRPAIKILRKAPPPPPTATLDELPPEFRSRLEATFGPLKNAPPLDETGRRVGEGLT